MNKIIDEIKELLKDIASHCQCHECQRLHSFSQATKARRLLEKMEEKSVAEELLEGLADFTKKLKE